MMHGQANIKLEFFSLGILLNLFYKKKKLNFLVSDVYTVHISFSFVYIKHKVQYVIQTFYTVSNSS